MNKKLSEAVDPFKRVLAIIDELPKHRIPTDDEPLGNVLPGIWPTLGELRQLVQAVKEAI